MINRVALLLTVLAILSPEPTIAYVYRGRPNCPWYEPSHLWKDYLSGRFGDKEPLFSVRFDKAPNNIGTIAKNRCYTVTYRQNGNWNASGWNAIRNIMDGDEIRHGGTPDEYKLNIWGRNLTFNERGEVIDAQFGIVGSLRCGIGPDC